MEKLNKNNLEEEFRLKEKQFQKRKDYEKRLKHLKREQKDWQLVKKHENDQKKAVSILS